jgi:hypothetical protein
MDIRLIKFGTIDALREFKNRHRIKLDRIRNTIPNGFNREELNELPQLRADMDYLNTLYVDRLNGRAVANE